MSDARFHRDPRRFDRYDTNDAARGSVSGSEDGRERVKEQRFKRPDDASRDSSVQPTVYPGISGSAASCPEHEKDAGVRATLRWRRSQSKSVKASPGDSLASSLQRRSDHIRLTPTAENGGVSRTSGHNFTPIPRASSEEPTGRHRNVTNPTFSPE